MPRTTKTFDAVKTMRKIRDRLSRRFEGMTFEEQKREMGAARRPKRARRRRQAGAKRAT
jgi:hypothetical protein